MVTHSLIYILWFFLPAIFGNMAPVIATRLNSLPSLNLPLDGYRLWRGQRIFGSHKTVRGLIWGTVAGSLTGVIQWYIYPTTTSILTAAGIGALLGFGGLVGDAIKSFFKRRWTIQPGSPWIPFDQIDFVLGAYLATIWTNKISVLDVLSACLIIGLGSYIVSFIAVRLELKAEI